jgi:DNA helicase-2/ATP-dependent DNA helicase PcrA
MDLEFVYAMIASGAKVLVAGDDDQSIYSFRFASPAGIQTFVTKYPNCAQHVLTDCFRSTPSVLAAAAALIGAHPQPQRISKTLVSLYQVAKPPVAGIVLRWTFPSGVAEARAIAESCRDVIAAGVAPRDILILLGSKPELLSKVLEELDAVAVPYEQPLAESFGDSDPGRFVLALMRIACDRDDYVAHRVLLGLLPGVGVGTCGAIADSVIQHSLNYRRLFYEPLPAAIFKGRPLKALNAVRAICAQILGWQETDDIGGRVAEVSGLLSANFSPAEAATWQTVAGALPTGMMLSELRDFLWADSEEQQGVVLRAVFTRLGLPIPASGILPSRIRVMTMHGAKGLSGKIVFIPGLEEEVLPGPWRRPYPGLVLEAARLLYVAMTRARAVCALSYARTRTVHGQFQNRVASRFAAHTGGAFAARTSGLTATEIGAVMSEISQL